MITVVHTNIYKISEYSQHLKCLSDQDKVSRFGYLIKDHGIDQLILNMVYHAKDHELWYVMMDDKRIGWGHMARDNDNSWEMALSVEGEYQGRGVANSLLSEMIAWAKFHKIDKLYMHCIEENRTIQHLARKYGLETQSSGQGERTAYVDVPKPDFIETNRQLWKESNELLKDFSRLQKRIKYLWTLPILPKQIDS